MTRSDAVSNDEPKWNPMERGGGDSGFVRRAPVPAPVMERRSIHNGRCRHADGRRLSQGACEEP